MRPVTGPIATSIYISYIFYCIKLKSRPSVRIFWSSGSSPWMQGSMSNLLKMKRPSSGNTKFVFILLNVLTPAVRHLRRFECQGVDDSCQNFTYIPANRSPDTIDNIYYCKQVHKSYLSHTDLKSHSGLIAIIFAHISIGHAISCLFHLFVLSDY